MTALTAELRRFSARIDWVLVFVALGPALVAILRPGDLAQFLTIAGSALARTSVYIAIAVALLAYLKASGGETVVARAFQGPQARMILVAALVGGLAPFCSCEVIPFVAGLLAVGAPLGAVMAFWLASPVMDPAQFMITAGALGWEYAIAKTLAAVAIGVAGGFAVRGLIAAGAFADPLKHAQKKRCGCGPSPFSGRPVWAFWREAKRVGVFRDTALEQAWFLLRWMALAYVLEAALILYVPAEAVGSVVGGEGALPVVLAALVGMPAYLNGAAAPGVVSGLMQSGMQPGAGLAFLIAGAVSSVPAMMAVWSLVKRPVFIAYLSFGVGGAIVSGLVFQALYS